MKNILDEVLHISDAAAIWKKSTSTLRRSFAAGEKFKQGIDCRKTACGDWLVTKSAMERVYGKSSGVMSYLNIP